MNCSKSDSPRWDQSAPGSSVPTSSCSRVAAPRITNDLHSGELTRAGLAGKVRALELRQNPFTPRWLLTRDRRSSPARTSLDLAAARVRPSRKAPSDIGRPSASQSSMTLRMTIGRCPISRRISSVISRFIRSRSGSSVAAGRGTPSKPERSPSR